MKQKIITILIAAAITLPLHIFIVEYKLKQIDKAILIENNRTNKIVQRNHQLYLKTVHENIRLNIKIIELEAKIKNEN
jgi:hypothetical protein